MFYSTSTYLRLEWNFSVKACHVISFYFRQSHLVSYQKLTTVDRPSCAILIPYRGMIHKTIESSCTHADPLRSCTISDYFSPSSMNGPVCLTFGGISNIWRGIWSEWATTYGRKKRRESRKIIWAVRPSGHCPPHSHPRKRHTMEMAGGWIKRVRNCSVRCPP